MTDMSALDAVYKRRSVRSFKGEKIGAEVIHALLDAAVHAPTAMHEEPWAFVVVQDPDVLKQLSDDAKKLMLADASLSHLAHGAHALDLIHNPGFNIFYNAGTLIVICGKPMGPFVVADCWLAAENLMLTAAAKGLGTCVIGFSVIALNAPAWKKKLGISENMTAFAPIIVGVPDGETPPVPRKKPEILTWL